MNKAEFIYDRPTLKQLLNCTSYFINVLIQYEDQDGKYVDLLDERKKEYDRVSHYDKIVDYMNCIVTHQTILHNGLHILVNKDKRKCE